MYTAFATQEDGLLANMTLCLSTIVNPVLITAYFDHIGGVMINVLDLSAVNHGFEHMSCQIKNNKIGSCCLSTNHAALMGKNNDWLVYNQDTVSEWNDISTCVTHSYFNELAL